MKVLVTMKKGTLRSSFIGSEAEKLLSENFDVTYNGAETEFTRESLSRELENGYDILLTGWGTPPLVGLEDKFSLLAHTGGSVGDLVDSESFTTGLRVISANSIYAASTAEGALSYILSSLRNVPAETALMKEHGYWKRDGFLNTRGLYGKTVGIVGLGAVARNLIDLMIPFGVRFKIFDTYEIDRDYLERISGELVSLDEVFSASDVISVHAALNEKTRRMITARHFGLIRDGALFVNTSRGAVIDEDALIRALSEKRFSAFLDVYEKEPLDPDSPLRDFDNVLLMPHKAGPANDLYPVIGAEIVRDMVRFRDGVPLEYVITRDEASRMTRHGGPLR